MSAGTGIRHSEFNHSVTEPVHFLQIWIVPNRDGVAPRYDQRTFPDADKRNRLRLVGSSDGRDGSIVIYQDVDLLATLLDDAEHVTHALRPGRKAWLQVARGAVVMNGHALNTGDGATVEGEQTLTVKAKAEGTEILVFDLP